MNKRTLFAFMLLLGCLIGCIIGVSTAYASEITPTTTIQTLDDSEEDTLADDADETDKEKKLKKQSLNKKAKLLTKISTFVTKDSEKELSSGKAKENLSKEDTANNKDALENKAPKNNTEANGIDKENNSTKVEKEADNTPVTEVTDNVEQTTPSKPPLVPNTTPLIINNEATDPKKPVATKPSVAQNNPTIKQPKLTYKGPVKNWNTVPANSMRYQLKRAAESMLGWNYSQAIRMTDGFRDCSSFVYTAMADAGFAPQVSWAWTTYTMPRYSSLVEQISWKDIQPGDIVLGNGHVAFYWGKDSSGNPMTLECCGTYGVTYGYMMCQGWNFPYTSVWRIKGIDGDNPTYTPHEGLRIPHYFFGDANGTPGNIKISKASSSSKIIEGKYKGKEEKKQDPINKLGGENIDLMDLRANPVNALELFLDRHLTQKNLDDLHKLPEEKQIMYLLEKVAWFKNEELADFLADYLGINHQFDNESNENPNGKANKEDSDKVVIREADKLKNDEFIKEDLHEKNL